MLDCLFSKLSPFLLNMPTFPVLLPVLHIPVYFTFHSAFVSNKYRYKKKERQLHCISRESKLVIVLIMEFSSTSCYSPTRMLPTSNFLKHVFYPLIASAILLSFCFLIWMNEWTWPRGYNVKADLCCCQSKLLSCAAEIILTCPLFRVQKNTFCSILQA